MPDLYLVSKYCALVVAQRLDFGNREVAVVQFGERLLQCGEEIVLQSELGWRREDARIHAIGLAVAFFGEELHLTWSSGPAAFGLVAEPVARRKQHEHQDEDHG